MNATESVHSAGGFTLLSSGEPSSVTAFKALQMTGAPETFSYEL